MKTITNRHDARCTRCNTVGEVSTNYTHNPVCIVCGCQDLRDPRGKAFEPTYGPARTYRASVYTPPMPDRRINNGIWPKIRERRNNIMERAQ